MNTPPVDQSGPQETRDATNPLQSPNDTLKELKTDGVALSDRVNSLNDTIDTLINDMQNTTNKKFKCKEYPSDDDSATRIKTIIRGVKDVFKDLEVYTDRHLEYVQKHKHAKFFDKTQVLLMQMATSTDDTKYQVLIYSIVNMVERMITLLNLFYDCSVEWSENEHLDEKIKQNIYLLLDLIEHQASYIVTLDVFFKKYAVDGNIHRVTEWMSKAGIDSRREKMKKLHKKFAPESKDNSVGCVIS